MVTLALISRQKLIETTVGFPREERIETMVRFSLIIRQKLIETTVGFPR